MMKFQLPLGTLKPVRKEDFQLARSFRTVRIERGGNEYRNKVRALTKRGFDVCENDLLRTQLSGDSDLGLGMHNMYAMVYFQFQFAFDLCYFSVENVAEAGTTDGHIRLYTECLKYNKYNDPDGGWATWLKFQGVTLPYYNSNSLKTSTKYPRYLPYEDIVHDRLQFYRIVGPNTAIAKPEHHGARRIDLAL